MSTKCFPRADEPSCRFHLLNLFYISLLPISTRWGPTRLNSQKGSSCSHIGLCVPGQELQTVADVTALANLNFRGWVSRFTISGSQRKRLFCILHVSVSSNPKCLLLFGWKKRPHQFCQVSHFFWSTIIFSSRRPFPSFIPSRSCHLSYLALDLRSCYHKSGDDCIYMLNDYTITCDI